MASNPQYSSYPTPPPTNSPKHEADKTYQHRPAQESYYEQPNTYTQPTSTPHWDEQAPNTYPDRQSDPNQAYQPQPSYQNQTPFDPKPASSSQTFPQPQQPSNSSYYTRPSSPQPQKLPPRRRSSSPSKTRHSPQPIYYSPTNPLPTPYNASRPAPRPGFLARLKKKIASWIRRWFLWCGRNPVLAGVLTFIPVVAGAGLVKMAKGLGVGKKMGKMIRSLGGNGMGSKRKGGEGVAKEWGWGMDEFVGFGGTKGGPLEGILKMMQMGV